MLAMADEKQIINGSYKGVPISIDVGRVTGGPRNVVKQFPNRNTESVESLGRRPRTYNLDIIVTAKQNRGYFEYRDALLAVLESEESGELIHPHYGRIESVKVMTFSLNERMAQFGDSIVSVEFKIDENTGIPQTAGNSVIEVQTANNAVSDALFSDVSDSYGVTTSFAGNFTAAVDKVNGIIDEARQATSFIGESSQNINAFNAQLGELSANVNGLVSDPVALARSINSLFESIGGLYASASATFETTIGFFGFGNGDSSIRLDTAGRVERQRNNDVLNGAVGAAALGYAYLSVSRIDFETTRQIDDVTARLDQQYGAVQSGGSSQDVKDSLTDMRVKVLNLLDQARVDAQQIIEVHTNPTSVRLLSFDYYGSDELADTIADLNDISDVSFIDGSVEILTE